MTTVNVVLTPGVDTDQTASAQAQINAAPDGTALDPTTINMPVGRFRMDGGLRLSSRNHIRWTCLAGVQTYPAFPSNSQGFIAYTDLSSSQAGVASRRHFQIRDCTNVIGSFLNIDGPNVYRNATYPLYANYFASREAEHGFSIDAASNECGFEDCSWNNVYGDGVYTGIQGTPNTDCWVTRLTGTYAGRHNLCVANADGFVFTDVTGDWAGFSGIDVEPNAPTEKAWNIDLVRLHMGSRYHSYSLTGGSSTHPSKKNLTMTDCTVIRIATVLHTGIFARNESEGTLTIDGYVDLRNRNIYGVDITEWDNVVIRNSTIRSWPNASTSYAVRTWVHDSLTITDNTFNGAPVTGEGFDNLLSLTGGAPTEYVHYGNTWAMGTQNDGVAPTGGAGTFAASKPAFSGAGTASNLAQGHIEAPAPTFDAVGSATFVDETPQAPLATVGGAPYRFRNPKGRARLRGSVGARMRGTSGPSERHVTRIRSAHGGGYVRSALFSGFLRSGGEGIDVTGSGGIAAPAATFTGLGAAGGIVATGSFTAAPASLAGTATESITGTGAFAPANAILAGTGVETNTAFGQFAAAAASFAGTGAEGAVGAGAIELAPAAFAGVGSEGAVAVGGYAPPVPLFAGVGTETISGTGAYLAPAAIFAGTSSEGIEGVGTFDAAAAILAGVVDVGAVTGSGGFTAAAPAFSGAGEGVAAGHGNFAAGAASFAGAASSEVLIVDVTYKTVRLPSTEKTVSYKRSMEKVGSP